MHYLESACKNLALLDTTLQKGVLQNDAAVLDINDLMNGIGQVFDIVHNALYYWRKDCLITNHHIVDTMHECHRHNLVDGDASEKRIKKAIKVMEDSWNWKRE